MRGALSSHSRKSKWLVPLTAGHTNSFPLRFALSLYRFTSRQIFDSVKIDSLVLELATFLHMDVIQHYDLSRFLFFR